jgi:hypothetical protein
VFTAELLVRIEPKRTASMKRQPILTTRQTTAGDNHHLWDNNGSWWFQGTFHLPDGTSERVRSGLRTKCVHVARRRRDSLIARFSPVNTVAVAA